MKKRLFKKENGFQGRFKRTDGGMRMTDINRDPGKSKSADHYMNYMVVNESAPGMPSRFEKTVRNQSVLLRSVL